MSADGWARLPVVVDRLTPLTRKLDNGEIKEVLYWNWGGRIYVHPDNWTEFQEYVDSGSYLRKENEGETEE